MEKDEIKSRLRKALLESYPSNNNKTPKQQTTFNFKFLLILIATSLLTLSILSKNINIGSGTINNSINLLINYHINQFCSFNKAILD